MQDWLKQNWWGLAIAATTLISTYTLYGYRLDNLEKRSDMQLNRIQTLESTNLTNVIALAQIQKDIEYIRKQVDKLAP